MGILVDLIDYWYWILSGVIALFLLWKSIVLVRGTEIAVLERKYIGSQMQQGRVMAMANEIGIQARTLGPGMHFLIPFLYVARKYPFMTIEEM